MPQSERLRVWRGELKKTSGGLTKDMLIKNKRGKIVSKKKSQAAKQNKDNNLGQWLRTKGDSFLSKGLKAENIVRKGKAGRKAFKKKVEEEAPKPKAAPKPKPKKAAPKITKTAPLQPGEKPKDKTKISVGNMVDTKLIKERKEYLKMAKKLRKDFGSKWKTKQDVIAFTGPPPKGFNEWDWLKKKKKK